MDALFGSAMPLAARFFIAFVVVLALIGLTAWLVRRFGANRLGGAARGRQPRLAVIDAASVDGRRRLVLIRRDNVEHLLMIGGPSDVVIEPNIVRAAAPAPARETARFASAPEPAGRMAPPAEAAWSPPVTEPMPPPLPRARAPVPEEPSWQAPEPARTRPNDTLSGLAAELSSKISPPADLVPPPHPVREQVPRTTAAPPMAPAAPTPQEASHQNQNLAEMAQQLEAALRRAPAPESRPPVTDALAVPPPPRAPAREARPRMEPKFEAPKVEQAKFEQPKFEQPKFEPPKFEPPKQELAKPEPPKAERPKREPKFEPPKSEAPAAEAHAVEAPKPPEPAVDLGHFEPKIELKPEPKFELKLEPRPAPKPPEAPTAPEKQFYDNLEEEMANLLGRPSGKS